jgi:hypothetical protein
MDLSSAELEDQLAVLKQTRNRLHHAVSLEQGAVETTVVKGPLTLYDRAQKLSRFGRVFDSSIFGGPSYRISSRHPYQANPLVWMSASSVTSYLTEVESISWSQPRDPGGNRGFMVFHFDVAPNRRSLFSISFSAFSWAGATGHITLAHSQTGASVSIPVAQPLNHHVDLAFNPVPGANELGMILEAGIQVFAFFSATLTVEPPSIILDH